MTSASSPHTSLDRVLKAIGPVAVAVSGGVDSMTLAHATQRHFAHQTEMFHAVSPAVPAEATARVKRQAKREGWRLQIIDAGEYSDADYRRNPVNRCFFCKSKLYAAIAAHTELAMVSGTNLDDLGDYRPGLQAAEAYAVRHPFVEAGIDKTMVRALAREFGLDTIAELPAAPCLSSRIETGIAIDATDLSFVHSVERRLTEVLNPRTVRCRIRHDGVAVELDPIALDQLNSDEQVKLRTELNRLCQQRGAREPNYTVYQRGSAFLRELAN